MPLRLLLEQIEDCCLVLVEASILAILPARLYLIVISPCCHARTLTHPATRRNPQPWANGGADRGFRGSW